MSKRATKITARHSSLTGWQFRKCLDALGVSVRQFARDTGRNEHTIRNWVTGKDDGTLPLWVDLVLMLYYVLPESEFTEKGGVNLPLDEWGARDPGHGTPES